MVDSGASCTLLSAQVFDALPLNIKNTIPKWPWNKGLVKSAAGTPLHIRETVYVVININELDIRIPALIVSNFSKDLLLGTDVLKRANIKINYNSETVSINDQVEVPMDIYQTDINHADLIYTIPDSLSVVSDRLYVVPPRSTYTIQTEVSSPAERRMLGFKGKALITDLNPENSDSLCFIPNTLVNLNNENFILKIVNTSDKQIVIAKGHTVAIIELVEEKDNRYEWKIYPGAPPTCNTVRNYTEEDYKDLPELCDSDSDSTLASDTDSESSEVQNDQDPEKDMPDLVTDSEDDDYSNSDSDSASDDDTRPENMDSDDEIPQVSSNANLLPEFVNMLQDIDKSTQLTSTQKQQVKDLLLKYTDRFQDKLAKPGQLKGVQATVKLRPDYQPYHAKEYRRPPAEHELVSSHINKMKTMYLIERGRGEWSSNPLLVNKKTGEKRFCINYYGPNKESVGDVFPLPRIDDMFDALSGATFFTTLDATSGYWQIKMKKEDRPILGFTTCDGLYQPRVLMFGIKNAPAIWQRAMNTTFEGLLWRICLIYIDDLLIYSKDFETHLTNLETCLQRARERNLIFRPLKCRFFERQLEFLGHEISGQGIHTSNKKIEAIKNILPPTTPKLALSFLGLAGFYRKFVKGFATITKPIYSAINTKPWTWTSECQEAFENLKEKLVSAPILVHPDFNKPFILECDASDYQIGIILSQEGTDQQIHPVCYGSRLLSPTEQNYSATERECLALVEGVDVYHPYLYGTKFQVRTDHQALVWLQQHKDHRSKLARWAAKIQEYDFEIKHRPGISSANVDALSRLPTNVLANDSEVHAIVETSSLLSNTDKRKELSLAQQRDPEYGPLIKYLTKGEIPSDTKKANKIVAESKYMEVENDILYHIWYPQDRRLKELIVRQVALPSAWKEKALHECHDSNLTGGHFGFFKTYNKIRERYFWPNQYTDVKIWIDTCKVCAQRKGSRPMDNGQLHPILAREAFEIVGMDFFGPLPTSNDGYTYIISFTDFYTKYVELFATKGATEEEVARCLVEGIICRHGCPSQLNSDRGAAFVSRAIYEVYKLFQIRKVNTTAWNPQANGQTENFNKPLATMISIYCDQFQKDWDTLLPYIKFAYNSSTNETTKFSPHLLLYGKEPRFPYELALGTATYNETGFDEHTLSIRTETRFNKISRLAQSNIEFSKHKMTIRANKNKTAVTYEPGELVWLFVIPRTTYTPFGNASTRLAAKLKFPWQGPYEVVRQVTPNTVELQLPKGNRLGQNVHVNRLKKYKGIRPDFTPNLDNNDTFDPKNESDINQSLEAIFQQRSEQIPEVSTPIVPVKATVQEDTPVDTQPVTEPTQEEKLDSETSLSPSPNPAIESDTPKDTPVDTSIPISLPLDEDDQTPQLEEEEETLEEEENLIPPAKAMTSISSHRITTKGVLEFRIALRDKSSIWESEEEVSRRPQGKLLISEYFQKKRTPIFNALFTQLKKQQILLNQPQMSLLRARRTLLSLLGPQSTYLNHTETQKKFEEIIQHVSSLARTLDTLDDILDNWNKYMGAAAKVLVKQSK